MTMLKAVRTARTQSRNSTKIVHISSDECRVPDQSGRSHDRIWRFHLHQSPQACRLFDHLIVDWHFDILIEHRPECCHLALRQLRKAQNLQPRNGRITTPFIECGDFQRVLRARLSGHRVDPDIRINRPTHQSRSRDSRDSRSSHSERIMRSYSKPLNGNLTLPNNTRIFSQSGLFCDSSIRVTTARPLAGSFSGWSGIICPSRIVASMVMASIRKIVTAARCENNGPVL